MHIVPGSLTFVIAGKWNKYILSHNWVALNIFKEKIIDVEFSIEPDVPFRYHKGNIRFIPSEQNVIFQALNNDKETLNDIEGKATNLISLLNITPISAFGINIKFIEPNPKEELLNSLNIMDKINENFEIKSTIIKRVLKFSKKTELNLTLSLIDNSEIFFDFNFHTRINNSDEFKLFMNENPNFFFKMFQESKRILNTSFNLIIEEEKSDE